jgi:hypothetical protein
VGETTATILVGTPHGLTAGLQATHVLLLSENDRPGWHLVCVGYQREPTPDVVWLPTRPDRILEDGLLMLALRVLHSPTVEAAVDQLPDADALRADRVVLGDIEWYDEHAPRLDEAVQADETGAVLACTVLVGSTLFGRLDDLIEVPWDVHVCPTSFARSTSPWDGRVVEERTNLAVVRHEE